MAGRQLGGDEIAVKVRQSKRKPQPAKVIKTVETRYEEPKEERKMAHPVVFPERSTEKADKDRGSESDRLKSSVGRGKGEE